jgi:filamentous hemagglutinin
MYPGVKRADLSEEQRQTISSLSTLAAGLLAGSLTGDSSANVVADAQAGKNAAENNTLNSLGDIIGSQGAKYFEGAGTLEEQLSTDGSLTDQEKQAIRAHCRKGDLPEDVIKTILEKILGQIP